LDEDTEEQKTEQELISLAKNDWETTGKYLIRDIPFFKYEIFAYAMMAVVAMFAYALEKTEILPGILEKALIPAIALPILLWAVKKFMFMPGKNRIPHLHAFNSGVCKFGLVNPTKGYINFGKGENIQRRYITKINLHREQSTGLPLIVTTDQHGENISLLKDKKPDMRSEEFNAILEMNTAVTTKNVMNRMMRFAKPGLDNPMFILLIINLFMVAVLLIKEFGILEMLKGG